MKRHLSIFLLCLALALGMNNVQVNASDPKETLSVSDLINANAFKVFDLLYEKGKNNVYSPASLNIAMAMLASTAEGDTKKQILNFLTDGKEVVNFDKAYSDYVKSLSLPPQYNSRELYLGGGKTVFTHRISAWIGRDVTVLPSNVNHITINYLSEIFSNIDFTKQDTLNMINEWIGKASDDPNKTYIKNITGTNRSLSLISSLSITDYWLMSDLFVRDNQPFYLGNNNQYINVEMLSGEKTGSYYEDGRFLSLHLNLIDHRLSLFVPQRRGGAIDSMKLSYQDYVDALKNSIGGNIVFDFPKFTVTNKGNDLSKIMSKLNVNDVFDEKKSNLSQLVSMRENRLYVSDVKQQCSISVTKRGFGNPGDRKETYLVGADPIQKYVRIIFNIPFYFVVTDLNTNSIVLMGVVNNPLEM